MEAKMDEEVSPLEREHSLSVLLPGGMEKNATVHGSKPVMDLLVTLCASYHLNPSDYTVEVLSPNKNNVSVKPNSPVGLLEAEKIVLKPKAGEEKIRTPYMPEASVRLLVNYNRSNKAVVRVNPRVPLEALLPVVCEKCEFRVESTVLLRDPESEERLDLSKTLNEHGLREVYARDTAAREGHPLFTPGITPAKVSSSSSLQDLTKKEKKSEHKGFLSLFRKHRKKSQPTHAVSAPSSPGINKSRSGSVITHDAALCTTPTADMPKKRRAPQPPMGAFHSFPNNLSSCHFQGPQTSAENTLRSTKRKAPPPPPPPVTNHQQEVNEDPPKDSLNPLEEERESEQPASVARPPSPPPAPPSPPAALHKGPGPQRPSVRGKDLSDARSALAKVLTSSLSSGSLVKRLKNTTPFPIMHNGSSCPPGSEDASEMKSILNSNLPTENEFEDPAIKTGLTTFKVVPSRRESEAGPIQDVPAEEGADSGTGKEEQVSPGIESEIREGPPDQSEGSSGEEGTTSCELELDHHGEDVAETAEQDGVKEEIKSGQSHDEGDLYLGEEEVVKECPTESKPCDTDDDKTEGAVQEDENFPPPPPPVYFEDPDEAKGPSVSEITRAVTNGHARSNSEPPQNIHSPGDPDKAAPGPSRFAQAVALAVQRSRLHSTGKTISALLHQET